MATNVPENIRAMWTDLYRFFDTHYLMDTGSVDAWNEFWKAGGELYEKHMQVPCAFDFVDIIGEMITKCAAGREKGEKL